MDFTGSQEFNDIFGAMFGGKSGSPLIQVGDKVRADLSPWSSVRGTLTSMPTVLNQFCVVDGWITKSGQETRDTRILVPYNLLRNAV